MGRNYILIYALVVCGCLAGASARGGQEGEALAKSGSLGVDESQLQKILPLLGRVEDAQYPFVKDGKIDSDLMGLAWGVDRGVFGRLLHDVMGFGTGTNSFLRLPEAVRQVRGWAVQPAFIDFFPTGHPLLGQVAEILGKERSSRTKQPGTGNLRGKEVTWCRYGDLHFGITNDLVCVLRVSVVRDRDGATDGKHVGEPNVGASEDASRKVSTDNPGRIDQPEMVRASHILLLTGDSQTGMDLSPEQKAAKRKQMEGLLKRARAGEDFADLVRQYSEDRDSKNRGGEYKFPRGQMVPEFEAAAFALNSNQISDIVTTRFGYHIIKLNEKIPKAETKPPQELTPPAVAGTRAASRSEFHAFPENWREAEQKLAELLGMPTLPAQQDKATPTGGQLAYSFKPKDPNHSVDEIERVCGAPHRVYDDQKEKTYVWGRFGCKTHNGQTIDELTVVYSITTWK